MKKITAIRPLAAAEGAPILHQTGGEQRRRLSGLQLPWPPVRHAYLTPLLGAGKRHSDPLFLLPNLCDRQIKKPAFLVDTIGSLAQSCNMSQFAKTTSGGRQHWLLNCLQSGLLLLAAIWVSAAHAATWYAAANGNGTNGTSLMPWSVEYAVGKTPNPHLKPGDTVLFKSGTFVCHDWFSGYDGTNRLKFSISGTPAAKITFRSETLWGFSFDGNLFLPPTSSNIVLHGFRVFSNDTTNRSRFGLVSTNAYYNTRPYTHPVGIEEYGPGNEILHNLIENTGHPGIGSWSTTRGKYIAGNIIRFAGYNDYTGDPAIGIPNWNGARRGAGMYLQNLDNSNEALIKGNILYFNYTESLYAFGSTDVWGFNFQDNICLPISYGIFHDIRNTASQGIKIRSNYVWEADSGVGIGLGVDRNHGGGGTNVIVEGNYLVAGNQGIMAVGGWKQLTVTNNTVINLMAPRYDSKPWYPLLWVLGGTLNTNDWVHDYVFDSNTYHVRANSSYQRFQYFKTNVITSATFADWQALQGEAHSTYTVGLPTNMVVNVFPPSTDSNFVHISVFNWPTNSTTTVNLSAYFPAGAPLAIYDAQDIPNAYTNLTFSGSTVTLDLTRTNRATMLGEFNNPAIAWTGFDPRFRAFVIHRHSSETFAPRDLRLLLQGQ